MPSFASSVRFHGLRLATRSLVQKIYAPQRECPTIGSNWQNSPANGTGSFSALEPRYLLSAAPIITEFSASNASGLLDGNGGSPDWIEIFNSGDQSIDLVGHGLTDDFSDIQKWVFPNQTLAPNEYLVVFASGDATPDPDGNLHTNFALSASGEYLALSDPSGNVLSEFGSSTTTYPALQTDESYGLAFNSVVSEPLTPTSSAKYFIPGNDDSVDAIWTSNAFDDSAWTSGTASIGYEETPADFDSLITTPIPVGTTSAYVRIQFSATDPDTVLDTLQMKYDDGFIAYINGTRVASANAPATGVHDSLATGQHADSAAVNYVDFDVSDFSGELVVGTNTLAIHMLNRNSGSSDFLAVPNLKTSVGGLIVPTAEGRMLDITPGRANTNLKASDVTFSRVGGTFTGPFQLTMVSSDPNETIRYTTDGSQPTASSPIYSSAITVNATTQFRARAFGPVGQLGTIFAETYTLTDAATSAFTSDLPIVVIENLGQGVPDREFEDASLSLYEVDDVTGRSSLASSADVTSLIGQHRRGSSTFNNAKPNLRIELRDALGEDQGQSLLGMPTESDFVLYAPFNHDRAMIRDTLLHELSRQMGHYAVRTRFVEVYANTDDVTLNSGDYLGVYVLMENIKRDSERVDIAALDENDNAGSDVTGGYIIKIDRGGGWETSRGVPNRGGANFVHVEPDPADLTDEQRDYIRGYVQDLEDIIYGPNATDPVLGYEPLFDVDASIDHHIIRVLSLEPDSLGLSTYLTKDRGGKLSFGPLWDSDRSLGSTGSDSRSADPDVWFSGLDFFEFDWWGELFDDHEFKQRWVDRWQELRQGVLSNANIQAIIDSQAAQLVEAQARNFAKWTQHPPNGGEYAESGLTGWEAEISHLSGWLDARVAWIDSKLMAPATLDVTPGNVSQGSQISLSSPGQSGSSILYTLDGSDPMDDDGNASPTAMVYTGPIAVQATTTITTRVLGVPSESSGQTPGTSGWSSPVVGVYSVSETPASQSDVRVSEVHFNPSGPTAAEIAAGFGDNNDFEFLELYNPHATGAINLDGMQLAGGVTFDFGDVDLLPGQRVVLVEDVDAFTFRYGNAATVLGEWSGKLSNSGEELTLLDSSANEVMSVDYGDSGLWSVAADGSGASLVLVDEAQTPDAELGKHYRWAASTTFNGTPGEASVAPRGVVINEVLAHTDAPQSDAIELFNTTAAAIDIGGWYLSDEGDTPFKFRVPDGTVLAAGTYLSFDESDFNPTPLTPGANDFALSSGGDQVYLTRDEGGLPAFEDVVDFGATFNGESLGRLPSAAGRLGRLAETSLGTANGAAALSDVVISEFNYHPSAPAASALAIDPTLTEGDLEFVAIFNAGSTAIDLGNYRLRGEADVDFALGTPLAAANAVTVVTFDPTTNPTKADAFRTHYSLDAGVRLLGADTSNLNNSFGRIALQQADGPPSTGPFVVIDEVVYDDLPPFEDADGNGLSLNRIAADAFGDDPASWVAAAPGTFNGVIVGDFTADGIVSQADLDLVLLNWGDATAPATWIAHRPDGIISQAQLDAVLLNWGNTATLAGLPVVSPPTASTSLAATPALNLTDTTNQSIPESPPVSNATAAVEESIETPLATAVQSKPQERTDTANQPLAESPPVVEVIRNVPAALEAPVASVNVVQSKTRGQTQDRMRQSYLAWVTYLQPSRHGPAQRNFVGPLPQRSGFDVVEVTRMDPPESLVSSDSNGSV